MSPWWPLLALLSWWPISNSIRRNPSHLRLPDVQTISWDLIAWQVTKSKECWGTHSIDMVTSSNENLFRVTGPLWGESTGHRWIPSHKVQRRGALIFSFFCTWTNAWANTRHAGDLRRHRSHYDVTVMSDLWLPMVQFLICTIPKSILFIHLDNDIRLHGKQWSDCVHHWEVGNDSMTYHYCDVTWGSRHLFTNHPILCLKA